MLSKVLSCLKLKWELSYNSFILAESFELLNDSDCSIIY
jgi:hypothetical protein